jgi:protein-tyrosine phosphatase
MSGFAGLQSVAKDWKRVMAKLRQVLFLCTGNYYRSRYAELVFAKRARDVGLAYTADSCGLEVELGATCNVGPISMHALEGLALRGIEAPGEWRWPRQVTVEDLERSDLVIALKRSEHEPMMQCRHPEWAARIEYWNVHDLDAAEPIEALAEIDAAIELLILRLRRGGA